MQIIQISATKTHVIRQGDAPTIIAGSVGTHGIQWNLDASWDTLFITAIFTASATLYPTAGQNTNMTAECKPITQKISLAITNPNAIYIIPPEVLAIENATLQVSLIGIDANGNTVLTTPPGTITDTIIGGTPIIEAAPPCITPNLYQQWAQYLAQCKTDASQSVTSATKCAANAQAYAEQASNSIVLAQSWASNAAESAVCAAESAATAETTITETATEILSDLSAIVAGNEAYTKAETDARYASAVWLKENGTTATVVPADGSPLEIALKGATVQNGEGTPSPDNLRDICGVGMYNMILHTDEHHYIDDCEQYQASTNDTVHFRVLFPNEYGVILDKEIFSTKFKTVAHNWVSLTSAPNSICNMTSANVSCTQLDIRLNAAELSGYSASLTVAEKNAIYQEWLDNNPFDILLHSPNSATDTTFYTGISVTDGEGNYQGYLVPLDAPLFDNSAFASSDDICDSVALNTTQNGTPCQCTTRYFNRTVLDGTESNWLSAETSGNETLASYVITLSDTVFDGTNAICNYYPTETELAASATTPSITPSDTNISFRVSSQTYPSLDSWKAQLAEWNTQGKPLVLLTRSMQPTITTSTAIAIPLAVQTNDKYTPQSYTIAVPEGTTEVGFRQDSTYTAQLVQALLNA